MNGPSQQFVIASALVHSLSWAMGAVSGFVEAARMPPEVRRRAELARWGGVWRQWLATLLDEPQDASADTALQSLRALLIGRSKAQIAATMGAPAATSSQPTPGRPGSYWEADTWYYPLSASRRQAVAVRFMNGLAEVVDLAFGPRA